MIRRSNIASIFLILLLLVLQLLSTRTAIAGTVSGVNQLYIAKAKSSNSNNGNKDNASSPPGQLSKVKNTDPAKVTGAQSTTKNTFLPMEYLAKQQAAILPSAFNNLSVDPPLPAISKSVNVPHEVAINLAGKSQIDLSDPIILTGNLKDITTGQGIPDKSIKFLSNGTQLAQTRTNTDGTYQVKIDKNLPAGDYQVTAMFNAEHLLSAASTKMTFKILPAIVQIQTVPAVEGITFSMGGTSFVTGADGKANLQISQVGQYRLDVLLDQYKNPSQQVQFGRWTEETAQPYRMVQVPSSNVIQVGLNIYHRVSLKFVDLDGFPIDPSRVASITIRSVQGDIFTLKPGDTPWLPAIRTARRQTGLEETDLLYSVENVTIDGSNVVNSAQQRFYAKPDDMWPVSLLLYSMHISARDALLRKTIGTSLDVVLPNGQTVNYPLNKSGELDLHGLARGTYHVNLLGARGLGTSTPVALSRNQVVSLNIVTKSDMIIFFVFSCAFALGLIIYGRPWLLHYSSRRKIESYRRAFKDFGA